MFLKSSILGEGELKIINWLNEILLDTSPADKVLICGGDSDIIIQSIMHFAYDKISILQKSYDRCNEGALCNISTLLLDIFKVHNLSEKLYDPTGYVPSALRYDVAFIGSLLGIILIRLKFVFNFNA